MYLVASSSPPSSPPPPCGDEKEEDSAEEEEADGGGGAPRDLGWAGAGRGGPGTAPLEPRDLGDSPQRTRSLGGSVLPSAGLGQARPLALAPTFPTESASLSEPPRPGRERKELPPPLSGPGGPPPPPSPLRATGRGPRAEEDDSPFPRLYLRKN